MEEALIREQIPYRILGGIKFYDRKEIKDLLAYLRFLVNPSDRVSFDRIINTPKRGIGQATIAKLQQFAYEKQLAWVDVLRMLDSIPDLKGRSLAKIKNFVMLMGSFQQELTTQKPSTLLESLIDKIEFLDYLKADDKASFSTRKDNIEELISALKEYEVRSPGATAQGYLEEVALLMDSQKKEETEEKVILMTLHNAKGLEYEVCFLIGLEEGVFPYNPNDKTEDELEEERRLCYVGITRAKKSLFLSSVLRRSLYGHWKSCVPSRFLEEIPSHLIDKQGKYPSYSKKDNSEPSINRSYLKDSIIEEKAPFYVGEQVIHQEWGRGQVLAVSGQGDQLRLKVRFMSSVGIKDLMAKYASLTKES